MNREVRIYEEESLPNLTKFEQMEGYAIDAYPLQRETGIRGSGDFSDDAREMAVRTVALHYNIPVRCVLDDYEVCIVPGIGFHGIIMARGRQ